MTIISLIAYGCVSVAVLLVSIHRVRRERKFREGICEREKRHAQQRARRFQATSRMREHSFHLA